MSRTSRPRRTAPSLAAHWARIAGQVRSANRVVLFLDFDGTLVDIAPLPGLVRLAPSASRVLRRLARHPRVTIVVISGRRRFELQRHVGLPGVQHFGLYGWERRSSSPLPKPARAALRAAQKRLAPYLASVPGAWIEDKRFSFSVHLLDVPRHAQRRVRNRLPALLQPFRKQLRLMQNLRDAEIVLRCIQGKGAAVKGFLAQRAYRGAFAFYFGDDLSDEAAFDALGKGISVHVGARPTRARYSIRNPAAVAGALARLEAALAAGVP
jgi:trehalose 6-phosphate phosphatase